LRFEAAVTDRIDMLLANASVRAAQEAAMARVEATLREMEGPAPDASRPASDPATQAFELALPDEAVAALRDAYAGSDIILEYGSGGSSFLAMELGASKLFTVESDAAWASRISASLRSQYPRGDFHVHSVDIGPTKAWGRPKDTSGCKGYPLYATSVWDLEDFVCPDVVLIDGRFRVACFLTVMLRCTGPIRVLFDDYRNRREYHWIEEFFTPQSFADRMAIFEVKPTSFPPEHLTRIAAAFVDPR
jgi:hypothetical protein